MLSGAKAPAWRIVFSVVLLIPVLFFAWVYCRLQAEGTLVAASYCFERSDFTGVGRYFTRNAELVSKEHRVPYARAISNFLARKAGSEPPSFAFRVDISRPRHYGFGTVTYGSSGFWRGGGRYGGFICYVTLTKTLTGWRISRIQCDDEPFRFMFF